MRKYFLEYLCYLAGWVGLYFKVKRLKILFLVFINEPGLGLQLKTSGALQIMQFI